MVFDYYLSCSKKPTSMQYRNKLMRFLKEGNIADVMKWMRTQPLLEQVDIAKEFRSLMKEIFLHADMPEQLDKLKAFDAVIENYQEKILDEQLAHLKAELALAEMEKRHIAEMHEQIKSTKNFVIDCILADLPNVQEFKAAAAHLIDYEKQTGTYNPASWRGSMDDTE
jgi:hypothetical protein